MKYDNMVLWKKMLGGVSGNLDSKLGIHQLASWWIIFILSNKNFLLSEPDQ